MVDFDHDATYYARLVRKLHRRRRIGQWDVDELLLARRLWRDAPRMWQDQQVWLHGDATPANFLFGDGLNVGAIDLERMKRGDRMFDLGRVAGELQHAFMLAHRRPPPGRAVHRPLPVGVRLPLPGPARGVPFHLRPGCRTTWASTCCASRATTTSADEYGATLVAQAKTLLRAS